MDFDQLSEGLDSLLNKPVGDYRSKADDKMTREVTRSGDKLEVSLPLEVMEEGAAAVLEAEGLDPQEWEVTGFRRSEWDGGKTSTRFTYRRRQTAPSGFTRASLTDAEVESLIRAHTKAPRPSEPLGDGETAVVLIADTQLGKIESDVEETVKRTMDHIDRSLEEIYLDGRAHRLVIAWMGDHIEGFVSQGGANAWRTPLALVEQIRLTRRLMIYALSAAIEYGFDVDMVAVPSNHGQAVRFNNKGVTRYDDDHCTEALLSVKDGIDMLRTGESGRFLGVRFFVPDTDELAVSLELSGTHTVFCHGHMARAGKYTDYVKGQAFNRNSVYHNADVVCFGHFHEFRVEMSTDRMIIVAPAGEEESTWFRHQSGEGGYPAIIWFHTGGGAVKDLHLIH